MDLMIPHIKACKIDREMNVSAYSSFLDLESLTRKKQQSRYFSLNDITAPAKGQETTCSTARYEYPNHNKLGR